VNLECSLLWRPHQSPFGAAEEMTEALINPYSIEETADAIRSALEMTLAERRERHDALLAGIQKHDAAAWSQSFLE
jgi:trehalose 6-phosphate synthase